MTLCGQVAKRLFFRPYRQRGDGKSGDGLAIIYHETICLQIITIDGGSLSFEYLAASLNIDSIVIILLVIYRPPSSTINKFVSEFGDLFESLAFHPGPLLVVGDFNIHVHKPSDTNNRNFLALNDPLSITQHVLGYAQQGQYSGPGFIARQRRFCRILLHLRRNQ